MVYLRRCETLCDQTAFEPPDRGGVRAWLQAESWHQALIMAENVVAAALMGDADQRCGVGNVYPVFGEQPEELIV